MGGTSPHPQQFLFVYLCSGPLGARGKTKLQSSLSVPEYLRQPLQLHDTYLTPRPVRIASDILNTSVWAGLRLRGGSTRALLCSLLSFFPAGAVYGCTEHG